MQRPEGMSQQRLSKISGVPRSKISSVENGYAEYDDEQYKCVRDAIKNYKGASQNGTTNKKKQS